MPANREPALALAGKVARFAADAGFNVDQRGSGRPVLLLHGGGGPASVASLAQDLARDHHVIAPTHPGFARTARAPGVAAVKDLARLYAALLERAGLQDVLVVGCSMGGWIAAEMAVLKPAAIAGTVLVDAVGIAVPGESVLDVFAIQPGEIASFSYHAPEKFRIDLAAMSDDQRATLQSNMAALALYGRAGNMQDPDLAGRLAGVDTPALVVWGESDRVVTPAYGRAFAAAFPRGRFELIGACGHLPQIEQPERLRALIEGFEQELRD